MALGRATDDSSACASTSGPISAPICRSSRRSFRRRRAHVPGLLRHSGRPCPGPGLLHPHAARRRLSRRRAPRGGLCDRALRRSHRARNRNAARRDPRAQLHQAGADAATRPRPGVSTTPASSRAICGAPWRSPTGTASRRASSEARGRVASAASGLPPISRPAPADRAEDAEVRLEATGRSPC